MSLEGEEKELNKQAQDIAESGRALNDVNDGMPLGTEEPSDQTDADVSAWFKANFAGGRRDIVDAALDVNRPSHASATEDVFIFPRKAEPDNDENEGEARQAA